MAVKDQRQQNRTRLPVYKERFKTLIANVPGAIYRCGDDIYWTMEFLNDEITTISGYRASDFIYHQGRSFSSIIYPEDRDRVFQEVQEAISRRKPYTVKYRITRSDGVIAWIKDKGRGIFDPDHKLQWLDGIILDITKKNNLKLHCSKVKYSFKCL